MERLALRIPPARSRCDNNTVTRRIRAVVWPALREHGFESFTGRSAWRHSGDAVDVVNFQSFGGGLADSVGCTSFSFAVNLGVWRPGDAGPGLKPDAKGRPLPQEWECGRRLRLEKSVAQPIFEPFAQDVSKWPMSMRLHRRGLKRVLRRDTHDRPTIWYVLPDGSNLEEMLADALAQIERVGLPWLEETRRAVG